MSNDQEERVKLPNTELIKAKSEAKNKTGTISKLNNKNFEDEELFLTTRQRTKIRNTFANNISTDIKLSKVQISKIIQSSGSFGSWLSNLGKKALTNTLFPLGRDNLPRLLIKWTSNAINKFERKTGRKGAVRAGKEFTLFISNNDVDDIIKKIKSLEDLEVLIDWVTETVRHEIKSKTVDFLKLY